MRSSIERWRKRVTVFVTVFWLLAASVIDSRWGEDSPVKVYRIDKVAWRRDSELRVVCEDCFPSESESQARMRACR